MSSTNISVLFQNKAEEILRLEVANRVNAMGGYGPDGATIYEAHPRNCPASLVSSNGRATTTFLSNGSVGFEAKLDNGFLVNVLDTSFDIVEKRERGIPSCNVWLECTQEGLTRIASIMNPRVNVNLPTQRVKIVKTNDPERAMWYCSYFSLSKEAELITAVRLRLVQTDSGPALAREIYIKNTGGRIVSGNLWTYFNLTGTQKYPYHKPLWYDAGMPISPSETIVASTVPHEDSLQLKRISSYAHNCRLEENTCDYATFFGDSSVFSLLPEAVMKGYMLALGARNRLNRFTTPTLAANRVSFALPANEFAELRQCLLLVTDPNLVRHFQAATTIPGSGYIDVEKAFRQAAIELLDHAPSTDTILSSSLKQTEDSIPFEISLPGIPVVAGYINSTWTGVQELYEKCRAQGAALADGIEVGTRDRGQDMWAKMKEDPARVRADLVHAFSFMYTIPNFQPMNKNNLTLPMKLHGMFPRQFPSRWLDRKTVVRNDNRPYADSPLWLVDALVMYIHETGDASILMEFVRAVHLTDPEHPETSGIVGAERKLRIIDVFIEIFASYHRHVIDSPYHLAQILFGDWCDPVDMMGTSIVGDPSTRGRGRGAQVRLSAHLCLCLVKVIDLLSSPRVQETLKGVEYRTQVVAWKRFADQLRKSILRVAWEDGAGEFQSGFIDCIHELDLDGSRPVYDAGQRGYTLGSMRGTDFDGVNRRLLTTQAYCLEMLRIRRDYMDDIPGAPGMIQKLLRTVDNLFFNPRLGLRLFSTPVSNNPDSVRLLGRIGIVPSGCAENGEYHHAQMFMHYFRLSLPQEAGRVWEQFTPILSVSQDENIGGPFDMTSNSYISDPADPHFGEGMYFGLSGSVDWIVELFQKIAGVELALHDDRLPAVAIHPRLPSQFQENFTFRRIVHQALPKDGYRSIPLTVEFKRTGDGDSLKSTILLLNGKPQEKMEVQSLSEYDQLHFQVTYVYG